MKRSVLFVFCLIAFVFFISFASASSVAVWQGQYYTGTTFNVGTYTFNFTVYDALTGGDVCFTNTTSLTTGSFGQWITEQSPWSACNNASKEYFLNINIDGTDETPRRRLTVSDFMRRDVSDVHEENITADYYLGDGRFLTGVSGSGDINGVYGDGIYLYNGSASGEVTLAFNETKLNATIDNRASGLGDNSSWNESYANTKYLNLSGTNANQNINISPYNLTLGDRLIFRLGEFVDNLVDGWLRITGSLNVTDNLVVNGGVNATNDSYFLSDIYVAGKVKGLSPVEIEGGLNVFGDTNFNNSVVFNSTVNVSGVIYGNGSQLTDITGDSLANESITNEKIVDVNWSKIIGVPSDLVDGDNDTTYSHLSNFTDDLGDRGYTSLSNFTNDLGFITETYGNATYHRLSDFSISDYFTSAQVLGFNYYNSTDFDINDYYLASNPFGFWNDTYATFNKTYADTLYASITVVDTQKNASGPYLYNDSTTIYFNETYLNGTIDSRAGGDNSSWNESYANTKYLNLSGTNANQDINIAPYNLEAANLTLGQFIVFDFGETIDNIVNTWIRITGNLNVTKGVNVGLDLNVSGNITAEEIHLENDPTNHKIYDNSTCVIIRGDTSTMYIC